MEALRASGFVSRDSLDLRQFLKSRGELASWWPSRIVAAFPKENDTETKTCQPYVSAIINDISNGAGRVHMKKRNVSVFGKYVKATTQIRLHSQLVDGHACVSYAGRKPDIVCYFGDMRGSCAITAIGDVKNAGKRNQDFPDGDIGKILDMSRDLLTKEQFTRSFMYCFLTDGYRFQFFRCIRNQRSNEISYEQSPVYGGEAAWQVQSSLFFR